MAKKKSSFVCQECGMESAKWMGRCSGCGNWNTLVEEITGGSTSKSAWLPATDSTPISINEVSLEDEGRQKTGIGELDRVLGGGLVSGSLILVGGDPGIGKSTLLLQVASILAKEGSVLYVSGEESARQIRSRAVRLNSLTEGIYIYSETDIPAILETAGRMKPQLLIVDSIQTVAHPDVSSVPGSVSQVRQCTADLLAFAKSSGVPVVLVGHVTKGGVIAGPKVLEHAVDTVLYFEGDAQTNFRILRAVKNRFGSTNEIGIFEMQESGLREVLNPSEMFMAERPLGSSGSIVVPCMEGTRPVLLEIQALVTKAPFGGVPRRQTTGVDRNRSSIILAVLEKRASFPLSTMDVYLNVAGGVKVEETAADLGIALAAASSCTNHSLDSLTAVFGELGLAGEVRAVGGAGARLQEAAKLGFRRVILPRSNLNKLTVPTGLDVRGVSSLQEALSLIDAKGGVRQ